MRPMRLRVSRLWLVPVLAMASMGAAPPDVPLIDAVRSADADAVRALLERSIDVNAPAADGATALHWAVHRDDVELVALLIDAGAVVTTTNRYGVQPLSLAAVNGNAAILERLLDAGADPNTSLPGGETALMTAARTGTPDAVRVLVAHGADVNVRDEVHGQTALMWAAARGNAPAIHVLAEVGADIHARTERVGGGGFGGYRSPFASPPPTVALFQATNSQLVNHWVVLQAIDQVVKVPMTDPQLAKSFEFFEGFGVDFVGHSGRSGERTTSS